MISMYIEIMATNGVGWRVPIPHAQLKIEASGMRVIGTLSFVVDEPVTLIPTVSLLTDDSALGRVNPEGFVVLAKGDIHLYTTSMSAGDVLTLDNFSFQFI